MTADLAQALTQIATASPGEHAFDYMRGIAREALAKIPTPAEAHGDLTDEQIETLVYEQYPTFDRSHDGPSMDDVLAIVRAAIAISQASLEQTGTIDMVLHCPACGLQHIDAPDERTEGWMNEPHRSHLCHGCSHIWRPADVPTNGVAAVKTKGKADSPIAHVQPKGMPAEWLDAFEE